MSLPFDDQHDHAAIDMVRLCRPGYCTRIGKTCNQHDLEKLVYESSCGKNFAFRSCIPCLRVKHAHWGRTVKF
eukprot:2086831-Amphidinium_carterae.1